MMVGPAISPAAVQSAEQVWTPSQALGVVPGKIIEWIDPATVTVNGSNQITDWDTKGPAGQILLSSSGACALSSTNGVPFVNFPATTTDDVFTNATTLNVVGLDVWILARMNTGKTGLAGMLGGSARLSDRLYTNLADGDIDAIGPFGNQLRAVAGSVPVGPWFIGRMTSDNTTASLEIDGTAVDTAVHSDTDFTFEMFGGCHNSDIEPWDGGIHSMLSVLGTPDAELEANLTTHFEALRDALNA